jgi:hypothetical protein
MLRRGFARARALRRILRERAKEKQKVDKKGHNYPVDLRKRGHRDVFLLFK